MNPDMKEKDQKGNDAKAGLISSVRYSLVRARLQTEITRCFAVAGAGNVKVVAEDDADAYEDKTGSSFGSCCCFGSYFGSLA